MIRGLSFKIPIDHSNILCVILNNIYMEKYYVKIVEGDEIYNTNTEYLMHKNISSGKELKKIICGKEKYFVYLLNMQLAPYKKYEDIIDKYEDFLKSNLAIQLFIVDGVWVEIYCKNDEELMIFKKNAEVNKFKEIEFITDINDGRVRFHIY